MPPSEQRSFIYPGNFGTFNGGGAVDPHRQMMFALPVDLAFTSIMAPLPRYDARVVTL